MDIVRPVTAINITEAVDNDEDFSDSSRLPQPGSRPVTTAGGHSRPRTSAGGLAPGPVRPGTSRSRPMTSMISRPGECRYLIHEHDPVMKIAIKSPLHIIFLLFVKKLL